MESGPPREMLILLENEEPLLAVEDVRVGTKAHRYKLGILRN
jgi:hypothetical protein